MDCQAGQLKDNRIVLELDELDNLGGARYIKCVTLHDQQRLIVRFPVGLLLDINNFPQHVLGNHAWDY